MRKGEKERKSLLVSIPLEEEGFITRLEELIGAKRTAQVLRGTLGAFFYLIEKEGIPPSELGVIALSSTKQKKPHALAQFFSKILGREIPPEVVERAIYGEKSSSNRQRHFNKEEEASSVSNAQKSEEAKENEEAKPKDEESNDKEILKIDWKSLIKND